MTELSLRLVRRFDAADLAIADNPASHGMSEFFYQTLREYRTLPALALEESRGFVMQDKRACVDFDGSSKTTDCLFMKVDL